MNIGDAARLSGLPAKTIRYYEEIGLVRAGRRGNGFRDYGEKDLHDLRFIARARGLGFSIEECRRLLALWRDRERPSAAVRETASRHIEEIRAKIGELQAMEALLRDLVARCAGDARPDCPILADLAGEKGA
jgi:Cu(I)-responsive transcriptional regulator